MGNKKEAVREIMRVLPKWDFDTKRVPRPLRGVRLDADGEVIATSAETAAEAAGNVVNHEFVTLGFTREGMTHDEWYSDAEWFVGAQPVERMGAGLIGHIFNRMEYEVFRHAVLQEQEDEHTQERSGSPDHAGTT